MNVAPQNSEDPEKPDVDAIMSGLKKSSDEDIDDWNSGLHRFVSRL